MGNAKNNWKKKVIFYLIVALILSAGLNMILLSGYENKEKKIESDKEHEKARLNAFLDSTENKSFRVKLNFYPAMNMDGFKNFAKNHGLKPVIFFGNNFGNKREIDEQLIKKYNLKEGDYITDVKQQMEPFLQKYENESLIIGHYSVVIEDENKIVYEEITTATSSSLTKSKIKELLNDKQVYTMELEPIGY